MKIIKIFQKFSRQPKKQDTSLDAFAHKVFSISKDIEPSAEFRTSAKERLMARIYYQENTSWKRRIFMNFWSVRRVFAGFFVVVFIFAGIFSFIAHPVNTEAGDFALLKTNGEVWVKRGVMFIVAGDDMQIIPGDIIETTSDSKAEIYFNDRTVSRLGSSTTVKVHGFYVESNKDLDLSTQTQLEVQSGNVYTRAIDSPRTKGVEVKTPHGVVKSENAAFNVQVSPASTEVVVKDNSAKVEVFENETEKIAETTVAKDQKVVLESPSPEKEEAITLANTSESAKPEEQDWLKENEKADEEYLKNTEEEVRKILVSEAGALPGDALYPIKKIAENAEITLTFDTAEKIRLELSQAKTRFAEAVMLLEEGKEEDATAIMEEYEKTLQNMYSSVEIINGETAKEIKSEIKEAILDSEEKLSLVLPAGGASEAKEALTDLKIEFSEDISEKIEARLENASQKITEAGEMIKAGDAENAQIALENYSEVLDEVLSDTANLSTEEKKSIALDILSSHSEKISTLSFGSEDIDQEVRKSIENSKQKLNEDIEKIISEIQPEEKENEDIEAEKDNIDSKEDSNQKTAEPRSIMEGSAGGVKKPIEPKE